MPRLRVGASSEVAASYQSQHYCRMIGGKLSRSQVEGYSRTAIIDMTYCCQFVDGSTCSAKHRATDKDVHILSCAHNYDADDEDGRSCQSNISTTEQIAHAANKWTDRSQGDECAEDKPGVSINTSDVTINDWWDGTKQIQRDLGASPEESHS